jgi:glyoxylase-like metal-dependent hydrolase (beta-lactamase superfamily II)
LTDEPVTVLLSHLHFDHSGNFHRFDDTALADLPILGACQRDGLFHAPEDMYLASDAHVASTLVISMVRDTRRVLAGVSRKRGSVE